MNIYQSSIEFDRIDSNVLNIFSLPRIYLNCSTDLCVSIVLGERQTHCHREKRLKPYEFPMNGFIKMYIFVLNK